MAARLTRESVWRADETRVDVEQTPISIVLYERGGRCENLLFDVFERPSSGFVVAEVDKCAANIRPGIILLDAIARAKGAR